MISDPGYPLNFYKVFSGIEASKTTQIVLHRLCPQIAFKRYGFSGNLGQKLHRVGKRLKDVVLLIGRNADEKLKGPARQLLRL